MIGQKKTNLDKIKLCTENVPISIKVHACAWSGTGCCPVLDPRYPTNL